MPIKNVLVILAAGLGIRYGETEPKQYTEINGLELLEWSMAEMEKSKVADKIVLVLNDNEQHMLMASQKYAADIIVGGADRPHSFQNALNYINESFPSCLNVVFHEAARPLVSHEIIDNYFILLEQYDYVETCSKIVDSLGAYNGTVPRREDYYLIQAPEAYRLEVLNRHYDCESDIYFAANQFPKTCKGYQCFDLKHNFKLTTKDDKVIIEALLKLRKI